MTNTFQDATRALSATTGAISPGGGFVLALLLNLAALTFLGVWGAAVAGLVIGLLLRQRGAFTLAFWSAGFAATLLLIAVTVRGSGLLPWANMIGANFGVPGWGLLLLSVLLPALQSGGLAGGVARLLTRHA